MENGDTTGRVMSPWFWVASLFIAPFIGSISIQWYLLLSTRVFAWTQAILTQLIFEHSLRIRFKAETNAKEQDATAPATPSAASDAGDGASDDGQSENTAVSKGKAKADDDANKEAPAAAKKDNLVGKINTLVTVDVDTIINAKEFLMFG